MSRGTTAASSRVSGSHGTMRVSQMQQDERAEPRRKAQKRWAKIRKNLAKLPKLLPPACASIDPHIVEEALSKHEFFKKLGEEQRR